MWNLVCNKTGYCDSIGQCGYPKCASWDLLGMRVDIFPVGFQQGWQFLLRFGRQARSVAHHALDRCVPVLSTAVTTQEAGALLVAKTDASVFRRLLFMARTQPMVGIAMVAAPIIMAIDTQYTVYAITDRRALIVRSGLRPDVVSCPFERMDATPEIMTAGGRGGHLYLASNMSTKLRDVDYTGKLAFRDLADVQMAAQRLEAARQGR